MNQPRILILDEDDEMRMLIAGQIQNQGFTVDHAASFKEAFTALNLKSYSLLMTDSKIPEISTSDFLRKVRELRKSNQLAILILAPDVSAKFRTEVSAAGADDILTRPFERAALLNKIKELLRKVTSPVEFPEDKTGQITLGDLRLDLKSFDVYIKGERLHLTPNEFKLLQALLSHVGKVLSRERLIELVQGYGIAVIDRAVDTHIFSLRKKLGSFGDWIKTVRGSGYRMTKN